MNSHKDKHLNEYLRIFKKYTQQTETTNDKSIQKMNDEFMANYESIGIGMGKTMLDFSTILPNNKIYLSASNQTKIFLASKLQHPLQTFDEIDVYFDSADAYDSSGNLIKGGGGSLTIEKLMLKMAKKVVIIVQSEKFVNSFENMTVPVEIIKESLGVFMKILKVKNIPGKLRLVDATGPFITDNGNYIVDICYDLEFLEECKNITGVIEHGYFPISLGYFIEVIKNHE